MKNTIFLAIAALFFSVASHAQSTVDSIEAKYKLLPMPDTLTIEKTFPALGTYQLSGTNSGTVTVTLDSVNKGIVWISGLPEGRMKAYLTQSPATYRILSQKTDAGKQISEGTLIYSPETNTLNIVLGAPFNQADPASVFANNTNADNTAVANDNDNLTKSSKTVVKTKKHGIKTKVKMHPVFYTGSKADQTTMSTTSQPSQQ